MLGSQIIEAVRIGADGWDDVVCATLPINASDSDIWATVRHRMNAVHGHRDVTCWRSVEKWSMARRLRGLGSTAIA